MFSSEKIHESVFAIKGEGCDSYLLPGDGDAAMIDAGMSEQNIRAFAEQVCGRTVRGVINTHGHFDHTAGNGFFDNVYATEGVSLDAKTTMGADPRRYPLGYGFTIVRDGDIVEIGGRRLQIIELNCHSPGNIAILDIGERLLFPGDEIDKGQVLLLPGYARGPGQFHTKPAASVETYANTMRKLKKIQGSFDLIFPAHNSAPVGPEWLDRFIGLAEKILNGYKGGADCSGGGYNASMNHFPLPDAGYLRAEWDGASLVYCSRLIWDADYANPQPAPATELHRICAII